ncbi:MAG: UPF0175 family protein [Candidatus Accumulibacter sp.]|uniref:UPF0175 family protein n=1 Tax=Candidatus Accumulibacter proximus TaxID=2954385 RepID=A0A935UFB8_9PROT|nr:UPF0175 family protein [Candidatus Accumulibacter proximus]
MQSTIEIECPREILLGLHLDADQFAELVKEEAAMALFREGRLSSGMAANWLGIPRAHFLLKAMQTGGANLLEDNDDDFLRDFLAVIVFSNTTPFIALASIGQLHLLPQLFGTVHVAESVIGECADGGRLDNPQNLAP